jgi:hypothetical protein
VFDPTAPNYCGSEGGVPAITRIMQSPIVEPGPLTFNGIDVGYVQYVDGFMRAQFWQTINGNPAYTNEFSFSVAPSVTINAGTSGITYQSGCQQLGISRTAPYMHDGSLMSLPQVIEYYDTGGAKNPSLDPKLRALHLSSMEKADLAAFLNSLTGRIQDGR